MPYLIGLVLSGCVAVLARVVGLDRDRAFYPTVTIVVASYYVLFGVMSGSAHVILAESIGMTLFVAAAVLGLKSSLWVVAAALAAHGAFDAVHGYLLYNPGMPLWWPAWCGSYDVGAAACLAWFLRQGAPAPRVTA